ncbi:hypothetical protein EDI_251290 [Entamoeba dispar SAW760]|uniref:Myb-like domain-containing protein n=1 Tax=Entamoeba dispar (strain ATCC PRA-260 / SAW760) TaxID=370354 RepID=B0E6V2_ENTDS|nr:uncharacterized protein EDI_251290 [Entamoeba dispar SAW760]EDR29693.1 hypothetical protein EDI_251290 [Entamoeba dispar SAW760]|eukprot:EDR29693.1 hypothetical protein EDI_251290 [Entamoeba dispar SAW760]
MSRVRSNTRTSSSDILETIATWTEEEQNILEQNMITFPAEKYTEFKRLALLLTNLPTKRLRDISLRLQFMKAKEKTITLSWDEFIKTTLSPRPKTERCRRESPTHSVKNSPRSPRSARDLMESPCESPRYKKPINQRAKLSNPTTPLNSCGSPIITQQTISQQPKDIKKILEENERIIEKLKTSVGIKTIDFKDLKEFYFNYNTIMEVSQAIASPNILPRNSFQPIIISENDFNIQKPKQTTGISFHIPRLIIPNDRINISPRSQTVIQQPIQMYQNPSQQIFYIPSAEIHTTTIIPPQYMKSQNINNTCSIVDLTNQSNQQLQSTEGSLSIGDIEDCPNEGVNSFINGSYGLTISSLTSQ